MDVRRYNHGFKLKFKFDNVYPRPNWKLNVSERALSGKQSDIHKYRSFRT